MAIVHRRIFYAKVGKADEVVNHMKEGTELLRQTGVEFKERTLTDYMTGRSDRVVIEWEVSSMADLETGFNRAMTDPQIQQSFATWFGKLTELITHAEGENWLIR